MLHLATTTQGSDRKGAWISSTESHEEGTFLLVFQCLLGLLGADLTVEPAFLQEVHHPIQEVHTGHGAEPLEHATKRLHGHHLLGVIGKQCLEAFEAQIVRITGNLLLPVGGECNDELLPADLLLQLVLGQESFFPHLTAMLVLDDAIHDDLVEERQNFLKGRSALRVRIPACLDQLLETGGAFGWDLGTFLFLDHLVQHHAECVDAREGILAGEQLPENNAERVDVGTGVVGFVQKDLGGHPQRCTDRAVASAHSFVTVSLHVGQTEIANTHVPVLVYQEIAGLEIAVNERRLRTVKPGHTQGSLLGELHPSLEGKWVGFVVQQIVHRTPRHQRCYNHETSRLCTRTHEEENVRMSQFTHNSHFFFEISHCFWRKILVEKFLHSNILSM
mmetsp:Transcript_16715/g.42736  ORF Transcript_16715/g.42736 Transcript_16715/m.42736 type:complete len:390 (+) Transcript_16715:231-1400(+)